MVAADEVFAAALEAELAEVYEGFVAFAHDVYALLGGFGWHGAQVRHCFGGVAIVCCFYCQGPGAGKAVVIFCDRGQPRAVWGWLAGDALAAGSVQGLVLGASHCLGLQGRLVAGELAGIGAGQALQGVAKEQQCGEEFLLMCFHGFWV